MRRDVGLSDFEIVILKDLLEQNESLRRVDLRGNPAVSVEATLGLCEASSRRVYHGGKSAESSGLTGMRSRSHNGVLVRSQVLKPKDLTFLSGIAIQGLQHLRSLDLSNQGLGDNEALVLREFMPTSNKAIARGVAVSHAYLCGLEKLIS